MYETYNAFPAVMMAKNLDFISKKFRDLTDVIHGVNLRKLIDTLKDMSM